MVTGFGGNSLVRVTDQGVILVDTKNLGDGPYNDLVAQINALTGKALKDPWLQQRYADLGATTWPTTPQEISAYRDSEEGRLLPTMKAAGIKPEGGG